MIGVDYFIEVSSAPPQHKAQAVKLVSTIAARSVDTVLYYIHTNTNFISFIIQLE